MIAYTFYESDNRVRRYAEALAQRGETVDVVALQQKGQPAREVIDGVRVFRIQRRAITEKSKFTYLSKLCLFFFRSMAFITREHIREPYRLVHIHSVPDFEVFAAILPKLTGSKIILDIHDIVPEFYASKFNASQDSLAFKALVAVERMSTAFADHVIVANHIWQERLLRRSVRDAKCTTILNFPDTRIFRRRAGRHVNQKVVMLYPGTLNHHQGVDIALRAFALIKDQIPEAEFHIYGTGDQRNLLNQMIDQLGLGDQVFLKGTLSLDQVAQAIENADLGIVPKRKDGFGNEAFSTKILEFMAVGVPVIIPDTMIDRYYFNDSVARFFRANDEQSLAETMLLMVKHPELRQELVRRADEFITRYTWNENRSGYLALVDSLLPSKNGHRSCN
ncbi:MAG: glycosyltransferase family 4 protein [Ktedonobacteraceae bacterium]